jgi:hypothetical protein
MIVINKPKISMAYVSDIWCRQMHFLKKGDIEQGHTHNHDHLTLLSSGALRVTVSEKTTDFVAPHMIFITKDKTHLLEALEDNTVAYCIHALRDKDGSGDLIDPSMIPEGTTPLDTNHYAESILAPRNN